MPEVTALLPNIDREPFVESARDRESPHVADEPRAPRSGRPKRLVAAVGTDVHAALERLRSETGAPVAHHVDRLLRAALGL